MLSRQECFGGANFISGQFISEYFHVKTIFAPLCMIAWPWMTIPPFSPDLSHLH